jgi:hypothetical protein
VAPIFHGGQLVSVAQSGTRRESLESVGRTPGPRGTPPSRLAKQHKRGHSGGGAGARACVRATQPLPPNPLSTPHNSVHTAISQAKRSHALPASITCCLSGISSRPVECREGATQSEPPRAIGHREHFALDVHQEDVGVGKLSRFGRGDGDHSRV